jgi:drug efflux transport system permease protein
MNAPQSSAARGSGGGTRRAELRSLLTVWAAVARKEWIHLRRDPRTLIVIFIQPVVLMVIYGYCITFDLYHIPFAVWDQDRSAASRAVVDSLVQGGSNPYFDLAGYVEDPSTIEPLLARGEVRWVLVIPHDFARDIAAGRAAKLQALVDGADSNTAGIALGYVNGQLTSHAQSVAAAARERQHGRPALAGWVSGRPGKAGAERPPETIDLRTRIFYNPDLSSRRFIVPGIIALLLTTLAALLTSTCIARERELGTLESVLISPVRPAEFVLGKLAPYVVIAAGNVLLVIGIGGFLFGVWPRGNPLTLAALTTLFLIAILSVGLLISAQAPRQQPALLLAILGTLLPTTFLTGFAFPRSNMPLLLQWISWPLAATQYMTAVRGVFLKGVGWSVLWPQGLMLALISALLLTAAVRRFKKQL